MQTLAQIDEEAAAEREAAAAKEAAKKAAAGGKAGLSAEEKARLKVGGALCLAPWCRVLVGSCTQPPAAAKTGDLPASYFARMPWRRPLWLDPLSVVVHIQLTCCLPPGLQG